MKIAVLGAGFTGLTAALRLSQKGHEVTVFEKEDVPGGLASGFKGEKWNWYLEKAYHHFFTNDAFALNLAREIGQEIKVKHPLTAIYYDPHSRHSGERSDSRIKNGFWTSQNDKNNNSIFPIDSPLNLLRFPCLSFIEKIRTGLVILYLKFTNDYLLLEKHTAYFWLTKYMGEKPFEILFKPLFVGKFGRYAEQISMGWFWARIKKRSPSLAYPAGGYQSYSDKLVNAIKQTGGKVLFNSPVEEIKNEKDSKFAVLGSKYDRVISTLPSPIFLKLTQNLNIPSDYIKRLTNISHLHALNLILELKQPFFQNKTSDTKLWVAGAEGVPSSARSEFLERGHRTGRAPDRTHHLDIQTPYWLNINDPSFPFLALVEHTNFMDKKHYNYHHLLYIGNYLPQNHRYFTKSKEELLQIFDPFLKIFNKNYKLYIVNSTLHIGPFAQPIITTNYSKVLPPLETGLKNLYAGNLDNVYPWDRGTNYAIELGEKLADIVINKTNRHSGEE